MLPVTHLTRSLLRVRACLLTGALAAIVSPPAVLAQMPGVRWTATLEDPALDYEMKAVAVAPEGGRVFVVIATARPDGTGTGGSVLGAVDSTGKTSVHEFLVPLEGEAAGERSGQSSAPAMVALKDGLWFALSNRAGDVALATVSPETGRIVAQRPANLPAGSRIMRMIRAGNGDAVMVGSAGERGLAVRVAAAGTVAWSRVLEEEALVLYDAAVTADDGVIVVGAKATNPAKPDLRNTRLWVGKFSATGQLTASKLFDVQLGSVAQASDGTFLLVSNSMSGKTVTVTARGLGADLSEKWTRELTTSDGFVRFVSAPVAGGGFIVAGSRERGLWIARLRDDGSVVWSEARKPAPPELESIRNIEVIRDGDDAVVAYTALVVKSRTQKRIVRVMRVNTR